MTDVSGIPNMGFGGGGYFGGIPNVAPAMSAGQINQGIWGNYSPGQAQSTLNNIYGPGGFGALPAHYAGLGAAYGRATGGFGGAPGRVGTIGNPGTSNPGYNPGGAGRGSMDWLGLGSGLGSNPGGVQRGGDLPDISPAQNPFISPQVRSPVTSEPRSPFTGLGFGGNRDFLASILRQSASPRAPAFPTGLGEGKADRLPLFRGPQIRAQGGDDSPASSGMSGGIGSDMLRGGQNQLYAQPWHSLIPTNRGLDTSEIIKQINYTAGRGRYDPAALANVINTESRWNPQTNTGSFFGATQMGQKSFNEAGGRLGGMNFGEYRQAPLERQIPAYGDWLSHYARPGNAAGLATSDIRSQSVPMQSAILQGTQFGPNSTGWPAALTQGNMGLSTSPNNPRTGLPYPQAEFLGVPPTISSMNRYFGRR